MVRFIGSAFMALITSIIVGGIMSFACAGALMANWWQLLLIGIGVKLINSVLAIVSSYLTIITYKIQGRDERTAYIPLVLYAIMYVWVPLFTVYIYIVLFGQGELPGGFLEVIAAIICSFFVFPNIRNLVRFQHYMTQYAILGLDCILAKMNFDNQFE